jgi:putative ribosome biogenesis GTPase RsgA
MSNEPSERSGPGDLFLVSAPSGAGKTTLIRGLLEQIDGRQEAVFSISHTTRRPRLGELLRGGPVAGHRARGLRSIGEHLQDRDGRRFGFVLRAPP